MNKVTLGLVVLIATLGAQFNVINHSQPVAIECDDANGDGDCDMDWENRSY